MTQRRLAKVLNTTRKTIARKIRFLASSARLRLEQELGASEDVAILEFDDLETYEHTKCKPLSVTLAVQYRRRRIIGFEVSQMPANGLLAKKSVAKYGPRVDMRRVGRHKLFRRIAPHITADALIKSDENPHYMGDVKVYFPNAEHERYKGRKPRAEGYGELKDGGFDPLFSLNHTAAMIRHSLSRMARKTWTTTKSIQGLKDHLAIYMHFHNAELIQM